MKQLKVMCMAIVAMLATTAISQSQGTTVSLWRSGNSIVATTQNCFAVVRKANGQPVTSGTVRFSVLGQSTAIAPVNVPVDSSGTAKWSLKWGEKLPAGTYTMEAKYGNVVDRQNFTLFKDFPKVQATSNTGRVGTRVPVLITVRNSSGGRMVNRGTIQIYSYGQLRKTVSMPASGNYTEQIVVRQLGYGEVKVVFLENGWYQSQTAFSAVTGT